MILNPAVRRCVRSGQRAGQDAGSLRPDSIGQSALLARRLVEAGSRFVTAAGYHSNSWDTHAKNDKGIAIACVRRWTGRCPRSSMTWRSAGLLESTVVLAMGEFGRTPFQNPDRGRDHWPTCWSLALGGGGIKGGQVVGASDESGANVTSRDDDMGDLYATIYKAFGIDWTKEYETPIGRPIKIANSLDDGTASPIPEVILNLGRPVMIRGADTRVCCAEIRLGVSPNLQQSPTLGEPADAIARDLVFVELDSQPGLFRHSQITVHGAQLLPRDAFRAGRFSPGRRTRRSARWGSRSASAARRAR